MSRQRQLEGLAAPPLPFRLLQAARPNLYRALAPFVLTSKAQAAVVTTHRLT